MNALKEGADALGIDAHGKPIAPASLMKKGVIRFDQDSGIRFDPVTDSSARPSASGCRRRFKESLGEAGFTQLSEIDIPIVTNIGCNSASILRQLSGYSFKPSADRLFITKSAVREIILHQNREYLRIVNWLSKIAPSVCAVFPPPARGVQREILEFFESTMAIEYEAMGASTYSPMSWSCLEGNVVGIREEFLTGKVVRGVEDRTHGNRAFGMKALQGCIQKLKLDIQVAELNV